MMRWWDDEQLALRLPFDTSQTLGYQFWCMLGAHKSYLRKLEAGAWQGFHLPIPAAWQDEWTLSYD